MSIHRITYHKNSKCSLCCSVLVPVLWSVFRCVFTSWVSRVSMKTFQSGISSTVICQLLESNQSEGTTSDMLSELISSKLIIVCQSHFISFILSQKYT